LIAGLCVDAGGVSRVDDREVRVDGDTGLSSQATAKQAIKATTPVRTQ
jgi:hypothetical protein